MCVANHPMCRLQFISRFQLLSEKLEKGIANISLHLMSFLHADAFAIAFTRSFIISMDMAHAVHPNYSERHQSEHAPVLNGGIVVKSNANQRSVHGSC